MSRVILVIGLVLLSAGTAGAQHEGHGAPAAEAQDSAACVEGARQGLQIAESISTRLESARQSNAAAELRAALADAQAALTQLRGVLGPCASPVPSLGPGATPPVQGAMDHAAMGHGGHEPSSQPIKDPVQPDCSEAIDPNTAPKTEYQGQTYYFCSEANRQRFLASPEKYVHQH